MRVAMEDLRLTHMYVVQPSSASFPLDEHISAVGLPELVEKLRR